MTYVSLLAIAFGIATICLGAFALGVSYGRRARHAVALRPIPVSERLPAAVYDGCYMNWVLVCCIARWCPKSLLHKTAGFYNEQDYLVPNATHWLPQDGRSRDG